MNLRPTECPQCRKPSLVFWAIANRAVCESCSGPRSEPKRILFCPTVNTAGQWVSDEKLAFGEMREFIEQSMRPETAQNLKAFLATQQDTIEGLINLLGTRVVLPETNLHYKGITQKITGLRKEIAKQENEVRTLGPIAKARIVQLNAMVNREPDKEIKKPLKKERGLLREQVAKLEQGLRLLQRKLGNQESLARDFLSNHPSSVQLHAIARLKKDFEAWKNGEISFRSGVPIRRVYWHLLKPSTDSWTELVRHYKYLSQTRNDRYEIERLKLVYDFHPAEIYVGTESFEGYVVFIFTSRERAVLECPKVGNAIYVMDSKEWKFLSQLSKKDLLEHHRQEVKRIVHSGRWQYEIKSELDSRLLL